MRKYMRIASKIYKCDWGEETTLNICQNHGSPNFI